MDVSATLSLPFATLEWFTRGVLGSDSCSVLSKEKKAAYLPSGLSNVIAINVTGVGG